MYYSKIKFNDVANGPGLRLSLFTSGCTHHCKGCFQPETWNFKNGEPFTLETQKYIIEKSKNKYIAGLSLLGEIPLTMLMEYFHFCKNTERHSLQLKVYGFGQGIYLKKFLKMILSQNYFHLLMLSSMESLKKI